jgi:hypothetical protein
MAAREAGSSAGSGPFSQLTAGVVSIATAPLQLPLTMYRASTQKNILYGATFGVLGGVLKTAWNLGSGAVRVATAVIPPNPMELVTRKIAYLQAVK